MEVLAIFESVVQVPECIEETAYFRALVGTLALASYRCDVCT